MADPSVYLSRAGTRLAREKLREAQLDLETRSAAFAVFSTLVLNQTDTATGVFIDPEDATSGLTLPDGGIDAVVEALVTADLIEVLKAGTMRVRRIDRFITRSG